MKGGLVQRFVHGNFAVASLVDSEADQHLGVPARQRQLLSLVKSQAAVSDRTLKVLETQSAELRAVVQNEIGRHSASLESAVQQGAAVVAAAVDELGRKLSAELVGILWELHQIRKTEDQILEVLKRPRSTEAKELLQQGVRHLVNDKIKDAEERLLLARQFDSTDYQILMNLSAVELHKGNADAAKDYVRDAMNLPAELDEEARCEALWWLARLHYVTEDYKDAVAVAELSLELESDPRRDFQYGAIWHSLEESRRASPRFSRPSSQTPAYLLWQRLRRILCGFRNSWRLPCGRSLVLSWGESNRCTTSSQGSCHP
ncbi:MAG: hypothetical protein MPN21_23005 [Thermoanaerobaculia bacterium]|nr:hypothetical protein [Thermoanaerobaculia bacterium]